MSILQPQPAIAISTNECKKQFLTSEINQMRQTKQIYLDILAQLKSILKETSALTKGQTSVRTQPEKRIQQQQEISDDVSINTTSIKLPQKNIRNSHIQSKTLKLNQQIQSFTKSLQQKISDYCCSQISQHLVKYLQIQNQQQHFHPRVIQSLSGFIKNHQKMITQREKQLQQIEDLKYINSQIINQKENTSKKTNPTGKYSVQKDRNTTEKTISSFDFNRRLLEMAKKEITFLKLKKRRLQMEIQEKKKGNIDQNVHKNIQVNQEQSIQNGQKFQNIKKMIKIYDPIQQSTTVGTAQQVTHFKKLPSLKTNSPLKQAFLNSTTATNKKSPNPPPKNDISAFEKIVMIYQKDKFVNSLLQQKIAQINKKLQSQKCQNNLLKQKTNQLDKQIQKLEWHKVCDSTFVGGNHNKKLDGMMELSILDRTDLVPCDEMSVEYSKMSINQSMIRRY